MHPSSSRCTGEWNIDIQCTKCPTPFTQRPQVCVV